MPRTLLSRSSLTFAVSAAPPRNGDQRWSATAVCREGAGRAQSTGQFRDVGDVAGHAQLIQAREAFGERRGGAVGLAGDLDQFRGDQTVQEAGRIRGAVAAELARGFVTPDALSPWASLCRRLLDQRERLLDPHPPLGIGTLGLLELVKEPAHPRQVLP